MEETTEAIPYAVGLAPLAAMMEYALVFVELAMSEREGWEGRRRVWMGQPARLAVDQAT